MTYASFKNWTDEIADQVPKFQYLSEANSRYCEEKITSKIKKFIKKSEGYMMDIDKQFEKKYDYYQELISNDHFDGEMYDKVDGILNIIWNSTDSAGEHFYNLESSEDKRTYIVDFTNACDWLISWNGDFSDDDYKLVAELVMKDRD